eukprot:3965751-Ditylum_brightwellii.AAC.1
MEKVKLIQSYDDGTTRTKKCSVFSGTEGIEGLLYVEERFRSVTKQLTYNDGPSLFNNFEEVLQDTAKDKWENLASQVAEADRDVPCFNEEIKKFYLSYCDNEAKDTMIDYLDNLKRPTRVTPQQHANCIETMVRYINTFPGMSPDINSESTKKLIFKQHPESWRETYVRADKNLATDSVADIVQFIMNENSCANKRDNNRNKKRNGDSQGDYTKKKKQKTKYHRGGGDNNSNYNLC